MRRLGFFALVLAACAGPPPPKTPPPALDVVAANPDDPRFIPSDEQVRRAELEAAGGEQPAPPSQPQDEPSNAIVGSGITTFAGPAPSPARAPRFEAPAQPLTGVPIAAPATTTTATMVATPAPTSAPRTFARPSPSAGHHRLRGSSRKSSSARSFAFGVSFRNIATTSTSRPSAG